MARPYQRRSYLDSGLPSEWLDYSTGSRAAPFISTGSSLGSLVGKNPSLIGATFDKLSAFEPKEKDKGSLFERFLNLQANPQSIVEEKIKLPAGFTQSMSLFS